MGGRKKKHSRLGVHLAFGSATTPSSGDANLGMANNPSGGLGHSDSDPQTSEGQGLQQAALSLSPATSRSSRLFNKFRWRSPSPSPSPSQSLGRGYGSNTSDQPTAAASSVWAKALEIAKRKLSDNNLPPLDLTNLTSQSAEENIGAVIRALNAAQEDDRKKRWSYTWRGKEVIVVERLGKILKSVEKYSKVVDTAIQSNPQVSALVWAGVWAIMRVRI